MYQRIPVKNVEVKDYTHLSAARIGTNGRLLSLRLCFTGSLVLLEGIRTDLNTGVPKSTQGA